MALHALSPLSLQIGLDEARIAVKYAGASAAKELVVRLLQAA